MRSALLGILLLLPAPAAADPTENVHSLDWLVHIDLIDVPSGFDLAYYQALIEARLAASDALVQGHQGPADSGCCVVLDPVSVTTFGSPGDGLDVINDSTELDTVFASGPGAILVQAVWNCGGTTSTLIRGCAFQPGSTLIVGLEADDDGFLSSVVAHERGHNAGLGHVSGNPCNLMSGSGGGGCLSVSECASFIGKADTTGGTCSCLNDTLGGAPDPIWSACSDASGCGRCSGGLCGACVGDNGTRLAVAGGVGAASGQTTDDGLDQSASTGDWDDLGAIGAVVTGLAYDVDGDVMYGIESVGGSDRLITLDPLTLAKTSTVGTLAGHAEVIALAFDPRPTGDRLLAIHVDDDYFGSDCAFIGPSPPCVSELFEIDPTNAATTTLGEVWALIITGGITGLAWDDDNEVLYAATPAGLDTIDVATCDGFNCDSTAVDSVFRSNPGLAWDPWTGALYRQGDTGFGGTEIDTIDTATGNLLFVRGLDPFTVGGVAARPIPEPAPIAGLVAGALALAALRRTRLSR
jgi:hypothetical protein